MSKEGIPWADIPKHYIRVADAVEKLRQQIGSYSRAAFYRDAAACGVRPLGDVQNRPALYPLDVVRLILERRTRWVLPPADTAAARLNVGTLPTLPELRRMKPAKAAKGKGRK